MATSMQAVSVGCGIISPSSLVAVLHPPTGAYWKEFQDGEYTYYTLFGADDKVVTDWVTITSDPNIIEVPTVNATAAQGIYTLSGVRVSNELKDLPKGIYIVNGKKVVKQ